MTPNLSIVKRLAADVLKCGRKRVLLNPSATSELKKAGSRSAVRFYISKRLILKKSIRGQSRARARTYAEARRKGRHMGLGKRKGTKNCRCPEKRVWIARQRVLRRCLKRLRESGKLDSHTYHKLYLQAKGNQFKNKKVLIDAFWTAKNQQAKKDALEEQKQARINKAENRRNRRNNSM